MIILFVNSIELQYTCLVFFVRGVIMFLCTGSECYSGEGAAAAAKGGPYSTSEGEAGRLVVRYGPVRHMK